MASGSAGVSVVESEEGAVAGAAEEDAAELDEPETLVVTAEEVEVSMAMLGGGSGTVSKSP